MKKQETLEEAKLRQLFKNRSNCYADSEDVIQAMDENCFIETINEWQQEQDKNKYSEEIIDILDNVRYWETCPDEYKVIIEKFIKQFKK
jgi:hypothetical protein